MFQKFLLMNSTFNSDKVNAYYNQDKPKKSIGSIATPPCRSANIAVEQTSFGNRVSNMSISMAPVVWFDKFRDFSERIRYYPMKKASQSLRIYYY